ncbi:MAG: hypothetical protein NZ781_12660 [Armatimonadetes bacterium]|nr:hypothetical protein [Armatimonadota bacterium]
MSKFFQILIVPFLISFVGGRDQPTISVTVEANWLNLVTNETKQAVIRPLVLIQHADRDEEPKTLQTFSGLKWKRWKAAGAIKLTITVRDARKRLSGIEIAISEGRQKFVPAQEKSKLEASISGTLPQNKVISTIFVHEGGRVVPKWRLFIYPERLGKSVQFLFELPATIMERTAALRHLFPMIMVDKRGFYTELSPESLRYEGIFSKSIAVKAWQLCQFHIPPFSKQRKNLATDNDEAIWHKWAQKMKEPFKITKLEKMQITLSAFQEGKVFVRYEATAEVLAEVCGEVDENAKPETVRKGFERALANIKPLHILPPLWAIFREQAAKGQKTTKEKLIEMSKQWMRQKHEREADLIAVLERVAASFGLTNLQVTTIADSISFEPKTIERKLRPLMVALQLKLEGKAKCSYHNQIHIATVSGKVRLAPDKPLRTPSQVVSKTKQKLWEEISDTPIEVFVPKEGTLIQLPFAWLHPVVSEGIVAEVKAKGWQLKPNYYLGHSEIQPYHKFISGFIPPRQPIPFPLQLEPTQTEIAVFLLTLPFDAQLRNAVIVIQDEKGKIIASERTRWLDDYGGYGILIKELPYGTYRFAAKGTYSIGGKERTFSASQSVKVEDYHAVLWLTINADAKKQCRFQK